MGSNAFGLEGSRAISDCIRYNKVIKTIFLNNNRVTYDAAKVIAESIRENSTLRTLDVNIYESILIYFILFLNNILWVIKFKYYLA